MNILPTPQAESDLGVWLQYIETLHPCAIKLDLERIKQVAKTANLLKPAPFVFTITGTNGKGTTCCLLENILLAVGKRVGVYSSPHLLCYTERVRIQGKSLSTSEHCQAFSYIEKMRGAIPLTYFEFSTLAALYLFQQAHLDILILEVGLGGRLDATNIVDADVSAITSIDLDHTDWLGNDRESIGYEKAGIFRTQKPAIIGESSVPQSVIMFAQQQAVPLYWRDRDWYWTYTEKEWHWYAKGLVLSALPLPQIPMQNAATALAILHYSPLKINENAIRSGLSKASLPGRFQIIQQQPTLILDVAHNPHAACYLAQRLEQLRRQQTVKDVRLVIGMLADKDIAGTLACLNQQVDHWYCVSLSVPRGANAMVLAQHLTQSKTFNDVISAWHQAMSDADEQDVIVVCGSFHTVEPVMRELDKERK